MEYSGLKNTFWELKNDKDPKDGLDLLGVLNKKN